MSTAGNIDLKLKSEKGVEIPLEVTDNEDGTYLVDYEVPAAGDYSLHCRYGDVQIPQSPLKIRVPSNVDVSKVKVDGLETSKEIKFRFYLIHNSDYSYFFKLPRDRILQKKFVASYANYGIVHIS